ncbi:MAG: hypothetical protein CME64_02135 [Halobacteriovoraceae bacterium]|nr:hypothetical protein [Halobacteriovoraceae bacterium]|tara:strand:- start:2914 stop:4221 length:1308 start_codon:yes stop_codon:yes gene_type:complete
MLKELLNSTPSTHAQGRVSTGEKDVFAMLGDQLSQDPEIAKMLMEQGEMPENFQDALKNMSFEDAQKLVENLDQQVDAAKLKQGELNQKLQSLLPENVTKAQFGNTEVAEQAILTEGKNPDAAKLGAQKLETIESPLAKLLKGQKAETTKESSALQDIVAKSTKQPQALKEQAALKTIQTPQTQNAEQAKAVQDGQGLVDLNQFMAKQSKTGKKRALNSQYKNEQQSMITNHAFAKKNPEIVQTQVEADTSASMDMNQGSEQLLNLKAESNSLQQTQSSTKVFDLNALNKSSNIDTVIGQIQDYIVQAKAAKEPTAQMSFNHPELGDIDLMVQKAGGDKVNVVIGHQGAEAGKFFQKHQNELVQTLQNSGIQVGEFKLESSSSSNNNGTNQNNSDSNSKQFANQQNRSGEQQQRKEDSNRREELWSLLNKERKSA